MLIRVRSNVGVWRVDGLNEATATTADVLAGIQSRRPNVVYETPLSSDPACTARLDTTRTLSQQGFRHGSMIYCRVDPATTVDIAAAAPAALAGDDDPTVGDAAITSTNTTSKGNNANNMNMKRIIDKDGCIKLIPSNEVRSAGDDRGFRKGMLPLRDIKMAWTLNEFVAMDSQFEFKIKRQESAICKQVSLDIPSITDFQSYLQRFQFQRKRFGFLYGTYLETGDDGERKARVEAIYEPPQEPDPDAAEGFEQLEDPLGETVEQIAALCGLKRVGWIFGHAPRQKGLVLTSAEVIMAAELQLEAAGGVEETSFVTVKVTTGDDGNVSVEAFQVSQQCMAMVAEEALEIGADQSLCYVNDTFTAIQEGKASKTVENDFFLTVVPIVQHTSETFVSQFPRMNRDLDDRMPSKDELKRQLSKSGTQGWTFTDLLADFSLLIFLSKFLDLNADFPKICQSVVDREVPLDDGYKIIIASVAGLDRAY